MKRRRIAIVVLLLLLLLPACGAWFLLYTEAGARWMLGVARDATGEALGWVRLEGSISGGLTLEELTFVTDGVKLQVGEINAAAKLTILPLGVNVTPAEIRDLSVSLAGDDQASDAETDIAALLESLRLPLPVRVQLLTATGVSVARDGETVISIGRIQLSLDWHESIDLNSFAVDGGPAFAATGNVALGLTPPFPLDASIEARADTQATGLSTPVDGTVRLSGSLAQLDILVSESFTGLDLAGVASALLVNPAWDLRATVADFVLDAEAGIGLRDAELSSAGTLDAYRLDAAVGVTGLVDDAPLRVEASASGSADGLDVEALELSHPTGQLAASGRLDFPAAFAGPVEIRELRLDQWLPGLDAVHVLSGRIDADATTDRLTLQDGRFLVDGTDIGIDIGGTIDLASGYIDAHLEWQALEWPLAGTEPRIQSRDGKAQISGTLDAWTAELSTVLAAPDIAEGRLVATGSGTRSAAGFDIVDGEVFGGAIDGSASLDWTNELRWSGEALVRGLRTAAILPAYPGILTIRVKAASNADTNGADLEIVDLRGTLLDEPLSGGGRVSVSSTDLAARDFQLIHGRASLSMDGALYAADGLEFDLRVPDLALYVPTSAGNLDVDGRISLKDDAPALALEASSDGVRIDQFEVGSVAVRTVDSNRGGIDLRIRAEELEYGVRRVDHIELNATLDPDGQRLVLEMTPLGHRVEIVVDGSMSEPGTLTGFPWVGTVEELSLTTRFGEGGGLDRPVPIKLSPDEVSIENLCLTGERRGRLCASFDFDAATGFELAAGIGSVPVDVLNAFLQTGFEFEQTVSGTLRWSDRNPAGSSGGAELRFTAGQLKSARFPNLDLSTGEGGLGFEVADGHLLYAHAELPLGRDGFVDGELRVKDIALGAGSPLTGSLNARTKDVDVFAVLLPDIDGAQGSLEANLKLNGTVGEPLVLGTASLRDGAVNYFPLGLTLTEINLDGHFDEDRRVELNGTFRAGEGRGEILSTADGTDDEEPGVHVSIRGDGLKLVELPDVSAVADADLELDYRNRRLDINGSIDIPYARIRPVNLVTARADESDDVVIVAGRLPDEPDDKKETPGLAVHGKLALGVGNDVQVILDVAKASIDGRADFEWNGDPVPIGRGRYNINGTVEAFGQVLNISEGRVSFPGVPATEPLLDIRATREIYGNTQIKRAGVLVQGSVQRPTIEAYTYPITTEERALTLLVTGNDFDYEQGVGAIDFGTYIAPRLFLSYGVGVFDRENIVSARYDLTTGFGVRATSGSRQSGVDLTYRLER